MAVDFSGSWQMFEQEDPEQFLQAMSVPHLMGKMMKEVKPLMIIKQTGDDFVVTVKTPLRTNTNIFTIGKEAEFSTMDGAKTRATAKMVDGKMIIETEKVTHMRELQGEEMVEVILVSSPSLAYMGHAVYRLRALEKRRHCRKAALRRELEMLESDAAEERRLAERELRRLEQGRLNKAPLRGSLLRTYCAHVLTRLVVEVGFMLGQHLLYGTRLEPVYRCDRPPCPNTVDCFVSRPTEKSMFMVFMQAMAAVSLFLSLLEILHLGHTKLRRGTAECCACVSDGSGEFSGSEQKKSSGTQRVCASQGRKATVLSAPTGGYFLLLEKKQANGPSLVPLARSTPTRRPSGGKKGWETQDEGGDSREDATQPAPPTSDSTSCPSGAAWTMQRISSRGTEKQLEKTLASFKRPTETQRCDFTAKQNERTMKSWSDSARSPALSPDRRTSLVSTGSSSRRATDLQV